MECRFTPLFSFPVMDGRLLLTSVKREDKDSNKNIVEGMSMFH